MEHLIKSRTRIKFFEKLKSRDMIRRETLLKGVKSTNFNEVLFDKGQQHVVSFKKIIFIDPEPYSIIV